MYIVCIDFEYKTNKQTKNLVRTVTNAKRQVSNSWQPQVAREKY